MSNDRKHTSVWGDKGRGGREDGQRVQRNLWGDGYAHYLEDGDGFMVHV